MVNPILQQLNPAMRLYNMVRSSGNPQAMLNQIAQTNPQMRQVLDLVSASGDPKATFYKMAQQKGVDPESILSMFR